MTSARPTIEVHSEQIEHLEEFCRELSLGLDVMTSHLLQIITIIADTHPEADLIHGHMQAIVEALTPSEDRDG